MSSVKQMLEENIKKSVENVISNYADQLSTWLTENKEVEVTREELCEFFEVPLKTPQTPNHMPNGSMVPQMPNYYGTVSTPKKRGGRTKKPTDSNLPKCKYLMSRGKKAGEQCTSTILNDGTPGADQYCKACLKKAAVKAELAGTSGKSTVQPAELPGGSVDVEEQEKSSNHELQAVAIEGRDGYFRETTHGFVVRNEDSGIVVVGICDEGEEDERPLTESEKTIALGMGLSVPKTKAKASPPPQPESKVLHVPSIKPKSLAVPKS